MKIHIGKNKVTLIAGSDEEQDLLKTVTGNPWGWCVIGADGQEKGLHLLLEGRKLEATFHET